MSDELEITRRTFLNHCVHFSALIPLVAFSPAPFHAIKDRSSDTLVLAYGDESRWRTSTAFTVGFLCTSNSKYKYHINQISLIREKHKYYRPFRYGSTDKYKIPYAEDLLHYFFTNKDLRFIARVSHGAKEDARYKYVYTKTVEAVSPHSSGIILNLVHHSITGQDLVLQEHLKRQSTRLKEIKMVKHTSFPKNTKNTNRDYLSELADFLTGNIALDLAGREAASQNPVKTGLLASLKNRLGISSFSDNKLKSGNKFRVMLNS